MPFEDLPAFYSLAEMFVFPSLYEGFGLPVIEAMACGTPVVTGPVAALTEVAGGAVEQVDRLDAESLGEAMVGLARSRERRENLSALGLQRSHSFSWDRAARETLEVYRQTVAAGRRGTGTPVSVYADVAVETVPVGRPHVAARTPSAPSTQ